MLGLLGRVAFSIATRLLYVLRRLIREEFFIVRMTYSNLDLDNKFGPVSCFHFDGCVSMAVGSPFHVTTPEGIHYAGKVSEVSYHVGKYVDNASGLKSIVWLEGVHEISREREIVV